jgi:aminopeptidase N
MPAFSRDGPVGHNVVVAGTPRLQGFAACAAAVTALLCAAPATAAPGATGTGDSFFPHLGNGGYDATHYDVDLTYEPKPRTISGQVRIAARATQELSSFTLDMRRWLKVRSVTLDGVRVAHRQRGAKLFVTPGAAIPEGGTFTVAIRYRGRPKTVRDPDGRHEGWIETDDGALVAAEPQGAPTWIPCNASLTDKATYSLRFTVPKPLKAISNGRLLGVSRHGRKRTWSWAVGQPMAAYLATVGIGRFRLFRSQVAGLPSIVAVDPRRGRRVPKGIARTPGMVALFAKRFGAYPFDSVGAIVDHFKGFLGLETQTRPVYNHAPKGGIHSHEIAHQWFGDSVGFGRWQDIWLAEGFAQWSMWLWRDHVGQESLKSSFRRSYSWPRFSDFYWRPPPGAVGSPRNLFSISVYERGAMTVEALRREVGNATFYAIVRDWLAQRRYGTGTVPDFTALAEQHAGRDLTPFFDLWLYRPAKPTGPLAHAP